MFTSEYNNQNPLDIERHAKQIVNYCLNDYIKYIELSENNYLLGNKGALGQLVENILFGYSSNSRKEADFKEAGVELKVTPLKKLKDNSLTIKERLVLSLINFNDVINETWETNTLLPKFRYLLLMFYLHENKIPLELIFKLVSLWKPTSNDMLIIQKDWEFIVDKIKQGKAHELSEADTNYLGACPKGKNSSDVISQPHSDIMAMKRAFCFKTSYMRSVYNSLSNKSTLVSISKEGNFEEKVKEIFSPYIGKSIELLLTDNNITLSRSVKHFNKQAIDEFIKIKFGALPKDLEEFQKANISLKTIVVNSKGMPKESMSFKQIKFKDIINENWEDFEINRIHQDGRFLWIIFKVNKSYKKQSIIPLSEIILDKVMFWSMPYNDLQIEYRKLWEDTKQKVIDGDYSHFITSKENYVGHIRPKGRDSNDLMETPQGTLEKKKCFWINASYIAEQIKKAI